MLNDKVGSKVIKLHSVQHDTYDTIETNELNLRLNVDTDYDSITIV